MAAIKSYSDLEQSRKLAKILPLESADMCWQYQTDRWVGEPEYNEFPQFEHATDKRDIFCWSLASLLGVLPKNLNIGRPSLESNYKGYYWIQYYDEFMKPNNYKTECFNNPVDACYELIVKLYESNLL